MPIWRVDDGPVYGIPWEQCQLASQMSQQIVNKGLPPSFDPNLECANVSYTWPGKTFSHVLSLAHGSHTLWAGILTMVSSRCPRTVKPSNSAAYAD